MLETSINSENITRVQKGGCIDIRLSEEKIGKTNLAEPEFFLITPSKVEAKKAVIKGIE